MIAYLVVTGIEDGYIFMHLFNSESLAQEFADSHVIYEGYPKKINLENGNWLVFSGSEDGYADVEQFHSEEEAENAIGAQDYEENPVKISEQDIRDSLKNYLDE